MCETRTCKECEVEKAITEFYKDKTSKGGRRLVCKPCQIEKQKQIYRRKLAKIKNKSKTHSFLAARS